MQRITAKENLVTHKTNINELLTAITVIGVTPTQHRLTKETLDILALLKMQLKGQLGNIEREQLENGRILHSLLESANGFV
jgi:hypothetical protein